MSAPKGVALLRVVAVTAAVYVAVMVLAAVAITALDGPAEQVTLRGLVVGVTVSSLGLAGAALLMGGRAAVARLRLVRVAPLDAVVVGLGTLGLGSALDALVFLLGLRERGVLGRMHELLGALGGGEQLAMALFVGLLPGLGEELFFRGYVLRKLAFTEGVLLSVGASAALFGLFHTDVVQSPAAALVGVYLALMVLHTGSLWTGVVAHALNNMGATLMAGATYTPLSAGAVLGLGLVCALGAARFIRGRRGAALPPATPW
ncbi:MAG: CPBP family intramembrane metalloprotease [Deltaproteobacteria bacterium]|nr:CPBP family intramembrane metalloprotease [Deltaproteobacteria bacterium]